MNESMGQWACPFGHDPMEDDIFVPSTDVSLMVAKTGNTEISRDAWFHAMCEGSRVDHTGEGAASLLEGITGLRADDIAGFWVIDEETLRLCDEIWECSPKHGDDPTINKTTKRMVSHRASLTIHLG